MSDDTVIDALVKLAPPVIALHSTKRGRCILATRIGCEVLRYFGVEAKPLAVNVKLMNAAMVTWVSEGQPGGTDEALARGAHMIEINEDVPGPGWSGHLVVEVDGGILDLDLQQFQRPEKLIDLPNAGSFQTGPEPWIYTINGSHLWYRPRRGDRSFMRAPDWRAHRPRNWPPAAMLIAAIKKAQHG